MNKAIRVLTMSGMGLLAGVAFSAAPAQAAGTTSTAAAGQAASASSQAQAHGGREWTQGYYRSVRACTIAGSIGERIGRWDDFDCDFVRTGFRRGAFALRVEDNRWGGSRGNNWGHGRGNDWGHDRDHGRGHDRDHHGRR